MRRNDQIPLVQDQETVPSYGVLSGGRQRQPWDGLLCICCYLLTLACEKYHFRSTCGFCYTALRCCEPFLFVHPFIILDGLQHLVHPYPMLYDFVSVDQIILYCPPVSFL